MNNLQKKIVFFQIKIKKHHYNCNKLDENKYKIFKLKIKANQSLYKK